MDNITLVSSSSASAYSVDNDYIEHALIDIDTNTKLLLRGDSCEGYHEDHTEISSYISLSLSDLEFLDDVAKVKKYIPLIYVNSIIRLVPVVKKICIRIDNSLKVLISRNCHIFSSGEKVCCSLYRRNKFTEYLSVLEKYYCMVYRYRSNLSYFCESLFRFRVFDGHNELLLEKYMDEILSFEKVLEKLRTDICSTPTIYEVDGDD